MNTGDTVRAERGATFEVGRFLGRGSWARTFAARHAETGHAVVIKVPLRSEDLGGDARLADACREILAEQTRLAEDGLAGIPELVARLQTPTGPAAAFRWAGEPIAERVSQAATTADILELAMKAVDILVAQATRGPIHGNLTGGNVLVDDRGRVSLTDPVTPTLRRHQAALYTAADTPAAHLAPELRALVSPMPLSLQADTWALCLQLTRALTIGQERFGSLPVDGLDKPRRVALKDQLLNRLRKEPSNPAFHGRLADRLVSMLNRALSRETSPSPPYRFRDVAELGRRFADVRALIHPSIESLGRLNWSLRSGADAFQTDEEVKFTLNVGCTTGVEGRDEIATGIALFDHETGARLREVSCAYSVDKHPSGRFRFLFKLTDLRPGTFRVRVAFTIRDSGDEPTTAEGEFHVRPAPGYVPPRATPSAAPLSLDRHGDEPVTKVTEPGVAAADRPTQVAPRLVRPTDSGASGRSRPTTTEDAPTTAGAPLTPTPIAPHRPKSPVSPPPAARTIAPHRDRPSYADDRASSGPASDAGERPSYGGTAAIPSRATPPPRSTAPPVRPRTSAPGVVSPSQASGGRDTLIAPPMRPSASGVRADGHSGRSPSAHAVPAHRDASGRPSSPGRSSTPGGRPRGTDPHALRAAAPASVAPAGPADLPDVDPSFPVMGSWVDLDVAEPTTHLEPALPAAPTGRSVDHTPHTPAPSDEDLGPVGAAVSRLVQLVKGDAYYMFLAVAIVLIIILGIALIAFRPAAG